MSNKLTQTSIDIGHMLNDVSKWYEDPIGEFSLNALLCAVAGGTAYYMLNYLAKGFGLHRQSIKRENFWKFLARIVSWLISMGIGWGMSKYIWMDRHWLWGIMYGLTAIGIQEFLASGNITRFFVWLFKSIIDLVKAWRKK